MSNFNPLFKPAFDLTEITERLVKEHSLATEQLTESQLASAIRQAIESGEFTRIIQINGDQSVTYLPYLECIRLREENRKLNGQLDAIRSLCSET